MRGSWPRALLLATTTLLSLFWHSGALRVIARSPSVSQLPPAGFGSGLMISNHASPRNPPQLRTGLQRSPSSQDIAQLADHGRTKPEILSPEMSSSSSVQRLGIESSAAAPVPSIEYVIQKLESAIACMSNMTWASPVLEQLTSAIDELEASTRAQPSEVA